MTVDLQRGALALAVKGESQGPITVAVCALQAGELAGSKRIAGTLADGETTLEAVFASKLQHLYEDKTLCSNAIVRITSSQVSKVGDVLKMMVLGLEVVGQYTGPDLLAGTGEPPLKRPAPASAVQPPAAAPAAAMGRAPVSPSEMPVTPGPAAAATVTTGSFSFNTPGSALDTPVASPTLFAGAAAENVAPGGSGLPVAPVATPHHPIESLNPYRAKWTIRAKVDKKQPIKQSMIKGEATSILTVVLVDESGTQIEGTFWRDMAVRMDGALHEGRIYLFSNGTVSPSNRRYSSVDNDYKINFSETKSDVREAPVQDGAGMKAKKNFTKIDCLASKLGKKVPVDVAAVVTAVGPLGSVKRQADGTEFVRRDLTLVDETRKTVTVTLWRDLAETAGAELEPLSHPTVALSKLKVSDFNGVSLSATYATAVEVNPAGYAATDALRAWWEAEGAGATFAPAGEGAARAGGAGAPRSEWAPLEEVGADRPGASEADKPAYASVRAVVTRVPEDQQLYYEANPATNKKVESDGAGGWVEAGTREAAAGMQRRYIMSAAVQDFTGDRTVNLFNEQAALVLGSSADELHAVKGDDVDAFTRALAAPAWSEWTLDVMSKPREYKGVVKMRVNVRNARPMDWAADCAKLAAQIAAFGCA